MRPSLIDWSGALHSLAWWLASTNRWRTTTQAHFHAQTPSDQACPLQSLQRTKRSGLNGWRAANPLVFAFAKKVVRRGAVSYATSSG